jgi:hypothetical protein
MMRLKFLDFILKLNNKLYRLCVAYYEFLTYLFEQRYTEKLESIDVFSREHHVSDFVLNNDNVFLKGIDLFHDENGKVKFNYDPISSYSWPNCYHYLLKNIILERDIKYPWEVGRLQFYSSSIFSCQMTYRDFSDEINSLEFINNPGFGVQWKCAMDVAIRAVNVSVYCDYYHKGYGFSRLLEDSVKYISLNLEKYGEWRGNHYLTNLAGLFICCLHLKGESYDKLLSFSLTELEVELDRQFLEDGSNFEGSTAYHNFALDIISTVYLYLQNVDDLCERLSSVKGRFICNLGFIKIKTLDQTYIEKLKRKLKNKIEKALIFSAFTLDQKGKLIQIGDNDSGKFIRTCFFDTVTPRESYDSPLDLLHQVTHILENGKLPIDFNCKLTDSYRYKHLLSKNNVVSPFISLVSITSIESIFATAESNQMNTFEFEIQDKTFGSIQRYFECFGLLVIRGDDSLFTFRCGPIGQFGKGGHDHYDQLSVTLYDSGQYVIRDPGTHVYTSSKEQRDLYRASTSHFGVRYQGEQDDFSQPFSIDGADSELIYYDGVTIVGRQKSKSGIVKYRMILIKEKKIVIKDVILNQSIENNFIKINYSPGYGVIDE